MAMIVSSPMIIMTVRIVTMTGMAIGATAAPDQRPDENHHGNHQSGDQEEELLSVHGISRPFINADLACDAARPDLALNRRIDS